ncbi:MAG: hypothetical protein ACI392_07100 [Paludibacteraceae bacterium]
MTVIINKMYNGQYLLDGHLGHEIINLYRSDNGNCYVYLNQDGKIPSYRKNETYEMIMVRTIPGKSMWEVLGVAVGLEDVYSKNPNFNAQKKYISDNEICYGGVKLNEIFGNEENILITFRAENVFLPREKYYIAEGSSEQNRENNALENVWYINGNLAKQSLRQYFNTDDDNSKQLSDLIEQIKNEGREIQKIDMSSLETGKDRDTFWDICGINNSELAWSNALAWYIRRHPDLLEKFAKEVLNVQYQREGELIVRREYRHIDLWIEDNKHIFIVENKIKSGINGILFTRHEHNEEKSKEKEKSQLEKYFYEAQAESKGRIVKCFVLTPNYNKVELSDYRKGELYRNLTYKELYDFLMKYVQPHDYFLQDWLRAMEPHTKEYSNDLYEDMKQKFATAIKKSKPINK